MENNNSNKPLSDDVFAAITSGRAKMRSKWYFLFESALFVIALVILFLMAIFLASFIIFVLHGQDIWFVPIFGLSGWYALFSSLPVVVIAFSMVFLAILAVFVRRYSVGYQWPLVYSMFGIFFLIVGSAFLFVQTSVYQELFGASVSSTVPFLGEYYPGIGTLTSEDIHRGQIMAQVPGGFELAVDDGTSSLAVLVNSQTKISAGVMLERGDSVVVFSDGIQSGTILAVGIQKIAE